MNLLGSFLGKTYQDEYCIDKDVYASADIEAL